MKHSFLCHGKLITGIWFKVAQYLLVGIYLGTLFLDCFNCRSFLSKRDVAPWHSHPVSLFARTKLSYSTGSVSGTLQDPNKSMYQNKRSKPFLDIVGVIRQAVLQQTTQYHILNRTESHGLVSIKPRVVPISHYRTPAAREIMKNPPNQPF